MKYLQHILLIIIIIALILLGHTLVHNDKNGLSQQYETHSKERKEFQEEQKNGTEKYNRDVFIEINY